MSCFDLIVFPSYSHIKCKIFIETITFFAFSSLCQKLQKDRDLSFFKWKSEIWQLLDQSRRFKKFKKIRLGSKFLNRGLSNWKEACLRLFCFLWYTLYFISFISLYPLSDQNCTHALQFTDRGSYPYILYLIKTVRIVLNLQIKDHILISFIWSKL